MIKEDHHNSPGTDPAAEAEWIRKLGEAGSNATEAFNSIYSRYQPKLLRYVLPFVGGSRIDAEEVLQRLFVRLWQKRDSLSGVRVLESYLYRMARNFTLDFVEEQRNQEKYGRIVYGGEEGVASPVEAEIALREYFEVARRAIALLPARRREIFLLSTQDDQSLDEIARKMGVSREVVKKQLYLANRFIRDYLGKHSDIIILGLLIFLIFFLKRPSLFEPLLRLTMAFRLN